MYYEDPFPHVLLDWSEYPIIGDVMGEFPAPNNPLWHAYENARERKRAIEIPQGPKTRELLAILDSPAFIDNIRGWFNISPEAALWGSLEGGGYHWLPSSGGKLGMHVDFNRGYDGSYRRVNCLVYLNPNWQPHHGGQLILSKDREADTHVKEIYPTWGTVVLFPTGQNTWHGNPIPCTVDRRSFAYYYFSDEPPMDDPGHHHSTVFADE